MNNYLMPLSVKCVRKLSCLLQELSGLTYFIIGAISKMVATFVTYPIQVVQSKLRVSALVKYDDKQ